MSPVPRRYLRFLVLVHSALYSLFLLFFIEWPSEEHLRGHTESSREREDLIPEKQISFAKVKELWF